MKYLDDANPPVRKNDMWSSYTDHELLRISQENPDAFSTLIERYEEAFLRKARKYVPTSEDAEDAVQEAFTRMYIHARRYRRQPGASFSSWAYTVLVNTCLTMYQKKKRERERFCSMDPEYESLVREPVDAFARLTLSEYVLSVLSRMPDSLANVLRAYFIEGFSQKEIAKREGVSVSAIKTRIHRAKKLFRELDR